MKLREFLDLYNFRQINDEVTGQYEKDTQLVRINFGAWSLNYVEFGVNDWENNKENLYCAFIKDDILDCEVDHFKYEPDLNEVVVTLNYIVKEED